MIKDITSWLRRQFSLWLQAGYRRWANFVLAGRRYNSRLIGFYRHYYAYLREAGASLRSRLRPGLGRHLVFWPLMVLAAVLLYSGQTPWLNGSGGTVGDDITAPPALPYDGFNIAPGAWSGEQEPAAVASPSPAAATATATAPAAASTTAPATSVDSAPPAEQAKASSATAKAVKTAPQPAREAPAAPFAPEKSVRPVSGALVRAQGWQRHPVYGDWRLSPGVDLQAAPGETVRSAYAGTVASVTKGDDAQSWQVVLDHGAGWRTEYKGITSISVQPAQAVPAGGALGTVSRSGAAVVTFVLRNNGNPVDPAPYLR